MNVKPSSSSQQSASNKPMKFNLEGLSRIGKPFPSEVDLNKLQVEQEIHNGGNSYVVTAVNPSTNERYAVKVKNFKENNDNHKNQIRQELELVSKLRHNSVIELYGVYMSSKAGYMISKYYPKGNLKDFMKKNHPLSEKTIKHLSWQLISAVSYLYRKSVVHHNLIPDNVLIDDDSTLKLSGFSSARSYKVRCKLFSWNPTFLNSKNIANNFKYDLYGLGICIFYLATKRLIFQPKKLPEVFVRQLTFECFVAKFSKDFKDFIQFVFKHNNSNKFGTEKLFNHKWFARDLRQIKEIDDIFLVPYNDGKKFLYSAIARKSMESSSSQTQDSLSSDEKFKKLTYLEGSSSNENKLDDFSILDIIYKGDYAAVFKAIDRTTKKRYAMKIIRNDFYGNDFREQIKKEFKLISLLQHPNIIHVYGTYVTDRVAFLIMDYYPLGNLNTLIYDFLLYDEWFPEEILKLVAWQMVTAVKYMHNNKAAHRDIKPLNFLFNHQLEVVLCDFGISGFFYEKCTDMSGTYPFRSPQVEEKYYDPFHADVWSLGVSIFLLVTKKLPFMLRNMTMLKHSSASKYLQYTKNVSTDFKDLMEKIFVYEEEQRIDINEITNHPWFAEIVEKLCQI